MIFNKGLHQDNDPLLQPEGTYRNLLNGEVNIERGTIISEKGTFLADAVTAGNKVIGSLNLLDGRIVVWTADATPASSTVNDGEIGIWEPDATYYTLAGSNVHSTFEVQNLRPDKKIQATFRVNGQGQYVVYYTDGVNPPKRINVDDALPSTYTINDFNLFPTVEDVPVFDLVEVKDGLGSLTSGAYQFSVAYITEDDFSLTNYFYVTNPIIVTEGIGNNYKYPGSENNSPSGVGIKFSLDNLDTSFYAVRVAVIKDQTVVHILPDLPISNLATGDGKIRYTYTGGETYKIGTLEEVLVEKPVYKSAQAISQQDNILYLGNVTRQLDIGYQKYANNIKVRAKGVTEPYDLPDPIDPDEAVNRSAERKYNYPIYPFKAKGFKRGEVYAFYISFILKDGTRTRAYHIPGREEDGTNGETTPVAAGDMFDKIGAHKDFHVNSKKPTGAVLNDGQLGFWENENETYPADDPTDPNNDDWEVWEVVGGTGQQLAAGTTEIYGDKVRHHRMPDMADEIAYDGFTTTAPDSYILMAQFYDIQIPDDLKAIIAGYEIHFAKKSPDNQLILDQSIGIPGVRDGQQRHEQLDNVYDNFSGLLPHGLHPTAILDSSVDPAFDVEDQILYMHPFRSMKDIQSVGSVTFLKELYRYDYGATGLYDALQYFWADLVYSSAGTNIPLEAIAYVGHNQINVELTDLGFSYDMNNRYGEAKIIAELVNPPSTLSAFHQFDLCQFREDLHLRFQDQNLVSTGHIEVDTSVTDTGYIVPGDRFLSNYLFTATTLWRIFDTTLFHSGGTEPDAYTKIFSDWPKYIDATPNFDKTVEEELNENALDPTEVTTVKNVLRGLVLAIGSITWEIGEYQDLPQLRYDGGGIEIYPKTGNNSFGRNQLGPHYINVTTPDISQFIGQPIEQVDIPTLASLSEESDPDRARFQLIWTYPSSFWYQWIQFYEVSKGNYYHYDLYYSLLNNLRPAFAYDGAIPETSDYSTRVVRSRKVAGNDPVSSWRTFLEDDKYDFPRKKGSIMRLQTFQNRMLIHTERTLYVMGAKSEIVTTDARAYVGAGDIFDTALLELLDTDDGYAGIQDVHGGVVTEHGYFFVDKRRKRAYLYTKQLQEISLLGVRNYLRDNIDDDGEIIVGVNDANQTVFFTFIKSPGFTLSYIPQLSVWEGFHSFIPDHYILGTEIFTTTKDEAWYRHDWYPGLFYGVTYNTEIEFVANEDPLLQKTVRSLEMDTRVSSGSTDIEDTEATFNDFRIYNDRQDTSLQNITYFTSNGNVRRTGGSWRINRFRDTINGGNNRLNSRWNIVQLVFNNAGNMKIQLFTARLIYKPSNR